MLDHLAADGAGFAGGQVTVIARGQINTDFMGCLHFETVHSLTGLGMLSWLLELLIFSFYLFRKAGCFPE